jgi:hypothetical protein
LGNPANIVEDDDVPPVLYDHTARFENTAVLRGGKKLHELPLAN